MNIREVVETQITQRAHRGNTVSGSADFALLMSLFSQPGPSLQNSEDTLNQHRAHAVNRPIHFSQNIGGNPSANIALLKALGEEPLADAPSPSYDPLNSVEQLISHRV